MLSQTSRYAYDPIVSRKPWSLPDDNRVAVVLYLNIEHFPESVPGTPLMAQTASMTPDVLNYGWRDYGNRVGLWRLAEVLDKHNIAASVCLNADVCREYPQIIEEGNKRNWEWMGHGANNTQPLNGIDEDTERALIAEVIDAIEQGTGTRPKGWLGPYLAQTFKTPDLLAEAGVEYVCDASCDDQPFAMNVRSGSLLSMPYSVEINDLPATLVLGLSGAEFGAQIRDQFDVLYAEGATNARVMPICLHTFIAGQAFRTKHVAEALDYIAGHDQIWFATAGEINDWYRKEHM